MVAVVVVAPVQLRLGVEQRSRFEHLENDLRTTDLGDATGLFTRTLFSLELSAHGFVGGVEIVDARAWTSDSARIDTTLVDPLELLQGHVGFRGANVLLMGDAIRLTAGRITLDLGSRRLVARNEFRNTINAFTGLDLQWTSPARDLFRAFATMPIVRFPADRRRLKANIVEPNLENTHALLWAVVFQSRPLAAAITAEAYVVGLHEQETPLTPSVNRQLYTTGVRLLRPPVRGALDFQLELLGQFGRAPADTPHVALALHASSGFRFHAAWSPRLAIQYDLASGDDSPDDRQDHRFDPLFGARRFELGPTGLFGVITRSNSSSPGVRMEVQPHPRVDAFASYRLVTTAALFDTPRSSSALGHQVEGRVRWHVFPSHLSLEVGGAVFARETCTLYFYTQITGKMEHQAQ